MTSISESLLFTGSHHEPNEFIAQYGRCAVSGVELGLNDWHCHHKNPYHLSKDDRFSNLIILHEAIYQLVHLRENDKIKALLNILPKTKGK